MDVLGDSRQGCGTIVSRALALLISFKVGDEAPNVSMAAAIAFAATGGRLATRRAVT